MSAIMQPPIVEEALSYRSGDVDPAGLEEKRQLAAQHLVTVIGLARIGYPSKTEEVAAFNGVMDTLSINTPSEGLYAALEYADSSLRPLERGKVYVSVADNLVQNIKNEPTDPTTEGSNVRKYHNETLLEAALVILTTDIDEEPFISAYDADRVLSTVLQTYRDKRLGLSEEETTSAIEQIQNTRLEILEKTALFTNQDQFFLEALEIYADKRANISPELRERALTYAIERCPTRQDIISAALGRDYKPYPKEYALKLLVATDRPDVIATALEMAIEDFAPYLKVISQLQAERDDMVTQSREIKAKYKSIPVRLFQRQKTIDRRDDLYDDWRRAMDRVNDQDKQIKGCTQLMRQGVHKVQKAMIDKAIPLLSDERGQSLFSLVYNSLAEVPEAGFTSDDMSSDKYFLNDCRSRVNAAFVAYAQHGEQGLSADQLKDILVFLNGLKQPVVVDK